MGQPSLVELDPWEPKISIFHKSPHDVTLSNLDQLFLEGHKHNGRREGSLEETQKIDGRMAQKRCRNKAHYLYDFGILFGKI